MELSLRTTQQHYKRHLKSFKYQKENVYMSSMFNFAECFNNPKYVLHKPNTLSAHQI